MSCWAGRGVWLTINDVLCLRGIVLVGMSLFICRPFSGIFVLFSLRRSSRYLSPFRLRRIELENFQAYSKKWDPTAIWLKTFKSHFLHHHLCPLRFLPVIDFLLTSWPRHYELFPSFRGQIPEWEWDCSLFDWSPPFRKMYEMWKWRSYTGKEALLCTYKHRHFGPFHTVYLLFFLPLVLSVFVGWCNAAALSDSSKPVYSESEHPHLGIKGVCLDSPLK